MTRLLMVLAVAATAGIAAQRAGPPADCPRNGARNMRHFDAASIETVEGTIDEVLAGQGRRQMGGIRLVLKTPKETIDVHLGPAWFVEKQEAKLQAGDTVSVRGSRTVMGGQPALIAIDVKRGGETLRLREEDGTPLWSAARGSGGRCAHAGM